MIAPRILASIVITSATLFAQPAFADPAVCNNLNWQNGFAPPQRAARGLGYTMIIASPDSPASPGPFYTGTPITLVQLLPNNQGPYYWLSVQPVEVNNSGDATETLGTVNFANVQLNRGAVFQTQFPSRGTYRIANTTGLPPTPYTGDMNICNAAAYTTLVQDLPTVTYVTTPGASAEVGKSLSFTVSGTKDSESINAQLSYEWDFGDGSGVQTTSSTSVSHTYVANGNYTVTVRAFDGGYYSSTQYHALSIVGPTTPTLNAEAVSCTNNMWTIAVDWSPTNSYPVGRYDVEVSDNFGGWMLIYSGTGQYTEYDAWKNTTQRFRAKACSTTNGCSALTTIRTVNLPNHCNMD